MSAATLQHWDPEGKISAADDRLSAAISRETGLHLWPREMPAMRSWVGERIHALRLPDFDAFVHLLSEENADARAERRLLSEHLTTGDSYFFRDAKQCGLLASSILPELIVRHARRRRLRIWSAGCSTGEEAYTLAILVDELGPLAVDWNVEIVATDISIKSLKKARRGLFAEWSMRSVDTERRARYFAERGALWEIHPRLRARVTFREMDLVREPAPGTDSDLVAFDLILCRNLFIYLTEPAIDAVTRKLTGALAPGGYLLIGRYEELGTHTAPLCVRTHAGVVAYQSLRTTARDDEA
jgi:chemotaxis protein methyltransferase CheR